LNWLGGKIEKAEKDKGGAYDTNRDRIADLRAKKVKLEDTKKEIIKKEKYAQCRKAERNDRGIAERFGRI